MKRHYALVLIWFALGGANAAPERPRYEPPTPPLSPTYLDLRDTQWHGIEPADRNIYFHADGSLGYTKDQKAFGTWKQEGNTVYFEFNKRYREFRGVIQGTKIQGDSWNVAGKRWQTSLVRNRTVESK